jgi:hypothetical protein
MGRKPVLGLAGFVLTGVMLAGCQSPGYFGGAQAYMPPSASPNLIYAQGPGAGNQFRAMPVGTPVGPTCMVSLKADGMDKATAPMQVTSSLQLVNGTSPSSSPTPMLTITLPAVKFMVPINGTYSLTPPQGMVATQVAPADAQAPHHAPAASVDGQVLQAIPQAPPASPAQPTIQYVIPTIPPAQAALQYPAPAVLPPPAPVQSAPAAMAAPKMMEAPAAASRTVPAAAPPPAWPKPAAEDNSFSDAAMPPPPPPIHRTEQALPQLP